MQLIIGAGPVGSATARILAARGERVRLVTRSGSGPDLPGVERVAADAADAARLTDLAAGATVVYNCANPAYHRWPELWPPIAAAVLAAAEAAGAVLVTVGNLYGYGEVAGPITERTPMRPTSAKSAVRVKMWQDALAAHRAGRVRATEARGSDYLGAGTRSMMTELVLPRVLAGKRAFVPGDLDAPHSFTYVGDVARTVVALGSDERAWGRAWHVPTAPAVSVRAATTRACESVGAPAPRLSPMPDAMLRVGGLFSADAREFPKVAYQWRRPFVLDSTEATATFGITATPLDEALAETAKSLTR